MKIFSFLFCLIPTLLIAQPEAAPEDWIPLFNGKNLEGWDIKIRGHELGDNHLETFRVEEGLLKVRYDQYTDFKNTFAHIFTQSSHSYYWLRAEYRFVEDQAPGGPGWAFRNNGLMLHSQSAASMGLTQDFPISIEVQLLGGKGEGERSTANLCTPGTNVVMKEKLFMPHCVNSQSKTYHGDQWVRVDVLVLGHSLIRHYVEGELVMEYTLPQVGGGAVSGHDPALKVDGQLLGAGHIALQGESHPTDFRKIELLPLEGCMDPKAENYRPYYVKADNAQCKYGDKE